MGIIACIVAASKGHKDYAIAMGVWTGIAIVLMFLGIPYVVAPGAIFLIIALCMENLKKKVNEDAPSGGNIGAFSSKEEADFVHNAIANGATFDAARAEYKHLHPYTVCTTSDTNTQSIPTKEEEEEYVYRAIAAGFSASAARAEYRRLHPTPAASEVFSVVQNKTVSQPSATKEPVQPTVVDNKLICPICGQEQQRNRSVCYKCGAEFSDEPKEIGGQNEPIKIQTIKVTFLDWDSTVLNEVSVPVGCNVPPPIVSERPGYRFVGWSKDTSHVLTDTFSVAIYELVTVEPEHVVEFLGFSGQILKKDYVKDGSAAIPPEVPEQYGFVFNGWNTRFDRVISDLSVRALYSSDPQFAKVTFLDWNSRVINTQLVKKGSNAIPPEPPEREGFDFIQWSQDYSCIPEDSFIMAIYEKRKPSYSVVFIGPDEEVLKQETVLEGASAAAPIPPQVDGYVFSGWEGDYSSVDSNITIHAVYSEANVIPAVSAKKPREEFPSVLFCRKCGNRLVEGSVFCNKCGTKVEYIQH